MVHGSPGCCCGRQPRSRSMPLPWGGLRRPPSAAAPPRGRAVGVIEGGEGVSTPPGTPVERGPTLVLSLARLAHDVFVPGPCPEGTRIGTAPPAGTGPDSPGGNFNPLGERPLAAPIDA